MRLGLCMRESALAGAKERGRRGSIRRCVVHISIRRAFAFTAASPSASNVDSVITHIFSGLMLHFQAFFLRLQRAALVSVTYAKKHLVLALQAANSRLACFHFIYSAIIHASS
jgi:hypothetical protein